MNILYIIDIMKLLKQYLNHCFVDIIIAIVVSDVRLNFEESHLGQTRRSNHASIFAYSDIIANSIQFEISKDHIKEIDNLFINYFYLFINLISRSFDDK